MFLHHIILRLFYTACLNYLRRMKMVSRLCFTSRRYILVSLKSFSKAPLAALFFSLSCEWTICDFLLIYLFCFVCLFVFVFVFCFFFNFEWTCRMKIIFHYFFIFGGLKSVLFVSISLS